MHRGKGKQEIKRFYFNFAELQCEGFKYKGKEGNANNFVTKEECEQACTDHIPPEPTELGECFKSPILVQF